MPIALLPASTVLMAELCSAKAKYPPRRLQHIHSAHYIRFKCFHRLLIRKPHERLGGEVENEIRLHAAHRALNRRQIADIANRMGGDPLCKLQLLEQARPRGRLKGKAMHLRTKRP